MNNIKKALAEKNSKVLWSLIIAKKGDYKVNTIKGEKWIKHYRHERVLQREINWKEY